MLDDEQTQREDQFEQALAEVEAGRGAGSAHLAGLSLLTPEQLARFESAWQALDVKQKLALVAALSREETESLRVDFNEIYHLGMLDDDELVRRQSIEALVEDDS